MTTYLSAERDVLEDGSSTLNSGHEGLLKNASTVSPAHLTRWEISKILSLVVDIVMICVSCLFIVYGLAVRAYEGTPLTHSDTTNLLERFSTLGPTIYPILFAANVGKALRSVASWKLEKGGYVGLLDQLIGSTTIFQTIATQVQMRHPSVIGITLILVWALSPLGGQASLRVFGHTAQSVFSNTTILYVSTNSPIMSYQYGSGDAEENYVPINALFGAALVDYAATRNFSRDSWSNVKIPRIEDLIASSPDENGWYDSPTGASSDDYASLLGLSFSEITDDANTTTNFTIETSYWTLTCPHLEDLGEETNMTKYDLYSYGNQSGAVKATSLNLQLASNSYRTPGIQTGGLDPSMPPRFFTYAEKNNYNATWVIANCSIGNSYVEVSVRCAAGICASTKLRRSQIPHPPSSWTQLDTAGQSSFYWYTSHFVNALKTGRRASPTPYQRFILDPMNALDGSYKEPAVSTVGNVTFTLRLGQLLNTYWTAMLAPTAIPKGLYNTNLTTDIAAISGTNQASTVATVAHSRLVLKCNRLWLAILIVSAVVTALLGMCGVVATISRRGPELGLNISSLIKDSPFVDQSPAPSILDVGDRARMCKNIFVKMGDVRNEEEVGYLAIGSSKASNLSPRRLYV